MLKRDLIQIVRGLAQDFDGSFIQFFFNFTALGKILKASNHELNFFEFVKAYCNTSRFTRFLFSLFYPNFSLLASEPFIRCSEILQQHQLLTADNVNFVWDHYEEINLENSFSRLAQAKLFNQENLNLLKSHPDYEVFHWAIERLEQFNLLTHAILQEFKDVPSFWPLVDMLIILERAQLLDANNVIEVKRHPKPSLLARLMIFLSDNDYFNQQVFNIIKSIADLEGLLSLLGVFKRAQMFNSHNFNKIVHHPQIYQLYQVLSLLREANILDENTLDSLLVAPTNLLISRQVKEIFWLRIPTELINRRNLQRLFDAARQNRPLHAIDRLTNELLGIHAPTIQVFNGEQNTHTASVHQSVSQSATRLHQRYGYLMNLNTQLRALQHYLYGLEDRLIHQVAIRALDHLISSQDAITEPNSGLNIKQLIALIYLAIQDDQLRLGSKEDAMKQLVQALYEIQRGYNLNEHGLDDNHALDRPICYGGKFNKLIEKLAGIHPDVELLFITPAGASLKLPIVVREEAWRYLKTLASPNSAFEYQHFSSLMTRVKDYGVEAIWPYIYPSIRDRMYHEFGVCYDNNIQHHDFIAMINFGMEVGLTHLEQLQQQVANSKGYQAWCAHNLKLTSIYHSKDVLWANRLSSPQAQRVFDRHLGLSLHSR